MEMKIFNKIKSLFKKDLTSSQDNTRQWFFGMSAAKDVKYKSYAYSCINARAENVSRAKLYLYQKLNDGRLKEWTSHPFLDLINEPNQKGQTFKSLLYRVSVSLDLYGDAYLYILRDKINGTPYGLYFLPSKQVTPTLDDNLISIAYYRYSAGGQSVDYAADDIIHFQIPDVEQNVYGKSTVSGFNFSLEIDYLQNLFQKKYFENYASPGLTLETDKQLSDTQFDKLKREIQEQYEGASKAGRTLLLEDGLKAKTWSNNPKDAALVENRNQIRDEILTIFRVPKPILSVTDGVNLANALTAIAVFTEFTIKPFVKMNIEDKINIFLKKNYYQNNLFVSFEYDEVDRDKMLKTYDLYLKYNVATINEIREMEGLSTAN